MNLWKSLISKVALGVHTCNASTQEAEAGGLSMTLTVVVKVNARNASETNKQMGRLSRKSHLAVLSFFTLQSSNKKFFSFHYVIEIA